MLVLAKWMAEQGCEVTSGFSHYFEWLGGGSMAKCRAQWGDNHCYQYQGRLIKHLAEDGQFDSFGNPDLEECESTNDRLQRYQSKLFDYDALGRRSRKTTVDFLWDGDQFW